MKSNILSISDSVYFDIGVNFSKIIIKITLSLLQKYGFGFSHYTAYYYFKIVEGKINQIHAF